MIDRARQEVLAAPSPHAAAAAHAPASGVQPSTQLPAQDDSTLVPMLVSGLILIVIAMAGVMLFA